MNSFRGFKVYHLKMLIFSKSLIFLGNVPTFLALKRTLFLSHNEHI